MVEYTHSQTMGNQVEEKPKSKHSIKKKRDVTKALIKGKKTLDTTKIKGSKKIIEVPKNACIFCHSTQDNENKFGKKYTKKGVTIHYFCMLFASGLCQNGRCDTHGILGFLIPDILKEAKRSSRLKCVFCKKVGATIGCVKSGCRACFHFGCGKDHGALNQFFGNFSSFCQEHRPNQRDVPEIRKELGKKYPTCIICMCPVEPKPTPRSMYASCCMSKTWYHRDCLQRMSVTSGLHFFKCPLCKNKDDFQKEMLEYGIYIPDQDAAWELEPGAYSELLERHSLCDIEPCLCPKGVNFNEADTDWELVLCDCCGSAGCHVKCGKLKSAEEEWNCEECIEIMTEEPDEEVTFKKKKRPKYYNGKKRKRKYKKVTQEDTPPAKRRNISSDDTSGPSYSEAQYDTTSESSLSHISSTPVVVSRRKLSLRRSCTKDDLKIIEQLSNTSLTRKEIEALTESMVVLKPIKPQELISKSCTGTPNTSPKKTDGHELTKIKEKSEITDSSATEDPPTDLPGKSDIEKNFLDEISPKMLGRQKKITAYTNLSPGSEDDFVINSSKLKRHYNKKLKRPSQNNTLSNWLKSKDNRSVDHHIKSEDSKDLQALKNSSASATSKVSENNMHTLTQSNNKMEPDNNFYPTQKTKLEDANLQTSIENSENMLHSSKSLELINTDTTLNKRKKRQKSILGLIDVKQLPSEKHASSPYSKQLLLSRIGMATSCSPSDHPQSSIYKNDLKQDDENSEKNNHQNTHRRRTRNSITNNVLCEVKTDPQIQIQRPVSYQEFIDLYISLGNIAPGSYIDRLALYQSYKDGEYTFPEDCFSINPCIESARTSDPNSTQLPLLSPNDIPGGPLSSPSLDGSLDHISIETDRGNELEPDQHMHRKDVEMPKFDFENTSEASDGDLQILGKSLGDRIAEITENLYDSESDSDRSAVVVISENSNSIPLDDAIQEGSPSLQLKEGETCVEAQNSKSSSVIEASPYNAALKLGETNNAIQERPPFLQLNEGETCVEAHISKSSSVVEASPYNAALKSDGEINNAIQERPSFSQLKERETCVQTHNSKSSSVVEASPYNATLKPDGETSTASQETERPLMTFQQMIHQTIYKSFQKDVGQDLLTKAVHNICPKSNAPLNSNQTGLQHDSSYTLHQEVGSSVRVSDLQADSTPNQSQSNTEINKFLAYYTNSKSIDMLDQNLMQAAMASQNTVTNNERSHTVQRILDVSAKESEILMKQSTFIGSKINKTCSNVSARSGDSNLDLNILSVEQLSKQKTSTDPIQNHQPQTVPHTKDTVTIDLTDDDLEIVSVVKKSGGCKFCKKCGLIKKDKNIQS